MRLLNTHQVPTCCPLLQANLGRYIKKKKLDPLDSYVPLVIEAQQQLQQLPPLFGECLHWCHEQAAAAAAMAATFLLCTLCKAAWMPAPCRPHT
jgi:hypothetical protein